MKAILEIRAGEGGDDSKLFIFDMYRMYQRYLSTKNIKYVVLHTSTSEIILEIAGDISNILKYEAGVHRVQRVPPTENNGRRHSSTITVAVLEFQDKKEYFNSNEVDIKAFRASGKGGQHRNKVETAIRAVHKPTGISAICADERSKYRNEKSALKVLSARVLEHFRQKEQTIEKQKRRKQIGQSGRAEKVRTYNFIENRCKDARVKKALYCLDRVMSGDLDRIYDLIERRVSNG